MKIDNPLEKIRLDINEQADDPLGVALQLGGIGSPFLAVLAAVKFALNVNETAHRMKSAIIALCDELDRVQERWPKDLNAALESEWFAKSIKVLLEESVRSASEAKAALLARATAQGCFPPKADDLHRREDLASYIRDLSHLGTDDVQFLKLLEEAYAEAIKKAPNLNDPNVWSHHYEGYKHNAEAKGIHPDDRVSLGARLCGLGLAYEPLVQPYGEYFVRPTLRGLYLLSLLKAAENSANAAKPQK